MQIACPNGMQVVASSVIVALVHGHYHGVPEDDATRAAVAAEYRALGGQTLVDPPASRARQVVDKLVFDSTVMDAVKTRMPATAVDIENVPCIGALDVPYGSEAFEEVV